MVKDSLFVVAIGGTGMRCLESFVHLCAIGMFDNEEINILTLDTDQGNGNKGRVEELIDLYRKIKSLDGDKPDGGQPNASTFFSAKINLFKYYTDYSGNTTNTYEKLSNITSATKEQRQENDDLSDLFFRRDTVQQFDLAHGYRAQTHLGSMLMYHAIIDTVKKVMSDESKASDIEKNLVSFIRLLVQAGTQARVFIFGSVFGGTGASSIPIIPRAFTDASALMDGNKLDLANVKFGSTLLTEYFKFNKPDSKSIKKNNGVVASSDYFAINSQAALSFYKDDPTVKDCYKRLYLIGWPLKESDYSTAGEVKTGGGAQKNPCHVVELMSACAAYDFFTLQEAQLTSIKTVNYLYRCVDFDNGFLFHASDFAGEQGDTFLNKLGAFFSLAQIILAKHGAAFGNDGTKLLLERFVQQNITDYKDITDTQAEDIDKYMRYFAYQVGADGIIPGWICQIRNSVKPEPFLFEPKAFPEMTKQINSIDPGDILTAKKHKWSSPFFGSRYDNFISHTVTDPKSRPTPETQKVGSTKERFIAHLYNGILIAQNYNQPKDN